ncbi:MAG: formate dehydrogenase accessory protein FdhE [Chromatiales bacterium]|nr:formate dehydrogenase accessory protein FdhE [Chromatiales bacterium]
MSSTRILQPGEIESFSAEIPRLLRPDAQIFATRAERLRRIAPGHSLGDYLTFVAAIADWQQEALATLADRPASVDTAHLARCAERDVPPLAPQGLIRDPGWRHQVRALAERLAPTAPAQAQAVLERLRAGSDDWLETQAEALLALDPANQVDIAASAILAAVLQVHWTAAGPDTRSIPNRHPADRTPSLPGLRLAPQRLCRSHGRRERRTALSGLLAVRLAVVSWSAPNAATATTCTPIGYHTVENPDSAIRAESCPECRTYLKILYQTLNPDVWSRRPTTWPHWRSTG